MLNCRKQFSSLSEGGLCAPKSTFHLYNTLPLLFLAINQHPIGQRVLPAEYIGTLDKPPNMLWLEFSKIVQDQFMERQKKEIERERKQLQQINAVEGARQLIEKQKQLSDKKKERGKRNSNWNMNSVNVKRHRGDSLKRRYLSVKKEKQQRAREQAEKEQREKEKEERERKERKLQERRERKTASD